MHKQPGPRLTEVLWGGELLRHRSRAHRLVCTCRGDQPSNQSSRLALTNAPTEKIPIIQCPKQECVCLMAKSGQDTRGELWLHDRAFGVEDKRDYVRP